MRSICNRRQSIYIPILFFILSLILPFCAAADGGPFENGVAEWKAERYEEAIGFFERAYKLAPKNPSVTYYMGLTNWNMKNFSEAERFFKETLSLDGKTLDAEYFLADIYYNTDRFPAALTSIDSAISGGVRIGQSHLLRGEILLKLNRREDAKDAFERAKAAEPLVAQQADYYLASAYYAAKDYVKSAEIFEGLVKLDPESDWALFSKDYLNTIKKAPSRYKLHVGVGALYDDNVLAVPINGALVDVKKTADWARTFFLYGEGVFLQSGALNVKGVYSLNVAQYGKSDYDRIGSGSVFSQDTAANTLSIVPSYATHNGVATLLASYSSLYVDYSKYSNTYELNPSYTFAVTGSHFAQVSLLYKRVDYDNSFYSKKFGSSVAPDENRTSDYMGVGAAYFYAFANDKGLFQARLDGDTSDAKGPNWDYNGIRTSGAVTWPLMNGMMRLNLYADNYYQSFTHVNTVYGAKRKDNTVTITPSVGYDITKSLDVTFGYTRISDNSSIAVYRFNKSVYSANLEYKF